MKKQFDSYEFTHICRIEPRREARGAIQQFLPQVRYKNARGYMLHAYGNGPFCKFRIPREHHQEGVYILTVDDQPYYVGECVDLTDRYNNGYGNISPRNCYEGGQRTNCRINNLILKTVQAGHQIDLWFFATDKREVIETQLIGALNVRDRWNRQS